MNDDDNKQLNTEEMVDLSSEASAELEETTAQTDAEQVDVAPVGQEAEETTPAEAAEIEEDLSVQADMEMEDSDHDGETVADQAAEAEEAAAVEEENEQSMTDEGVEPVTETVDETTVENSDEEADDQQIDESANQDDETETAVEEETTEEDPNDPKNANPNAKWYVVHTYSGHENRVATTLRQRIETEGLEHKIVDILVPTQDKIEIRGGKKEQVKEKLFPGYMYVKMELDNTTWIAVRTTQGVIGFVGAGTKPMPISDSEVKSIMQFMNQGAAPTFKEVFNVDDPVKIIDGPFADFIGKIESVDKEKGKLRVLVSIFGRETPVELDFLQVSKL